MSRTGSSRPAPAPGDIPVVRAAIAEAMARGVEPGAMLLQLTHRDASIFKRSRDIGDDEISFEGGRMRFLGVLVEVGQVTVSGLTLP